MSIFTSLYTASCPVHTITVTKLYKHKYTGTDYEMKMSHVKPRSNDFLFQAHTVSLLCKAWKLYMLLLTTFTGMIMTVISITNRYQYLVYLNTRTTVLHVLEPLLRWLDTPSTHKYQCTYLGNWTQALMGIFLQHGTPLPKPGLEPTGWQSTALPAEPCIYWIVCNQEVFYILTG